LLRLEEVPEWVSIAAVDLDLGEHVKLYPVPLSKLLDLCLTSWFLASKLVAGEAKDGESLRLILSVKLHQFGVVHVCLASLAGHVYHDTYPVLVLLH